MFCANCGAVNPDGGRFCVRCGSALAVPSATSAPPPMPSPASAPPVALPVPPHIPSGVASNLPPGTHPTIYAGGAPVYAKPPEASGKALASLIFGLFFWIFPSAVVAIILGHLSLSEINKAAGRLKGRGLAIAGLVLGYGGVLMIPFILIVAAIAIPNLLRAKMAANEASAVGSLRVLNTAAVTYGATYGNGFPPSLDAMAGGGSGASSCDHAQLLNRSLAEGQKSGYEFVYFLEPRPDGPPQLSPTAMANGCTVPGGSMYEIHADPVNRGSAGQRSFYTDQTGIIRWENSRPATGDSDVLE